MRAVLIRLESWPLVAWTLYAAIGLFATLGLVLVACDGRDHPSDTRLEIRVPKLPKAKKANPPDDFIPRHTVYPDVASAAVAILVDQPRVIGIGEIHERTDRDGGGKPALVRLAGELLPALASRTSDLVIETWMVDPACKTGVAQSHQVETAMRRPTSTKTQISSLFGVTKANSITAHVMRLTCADLDAVANQAGVEAEQLLAIVTRELDRVTRSAVRYRDEHQETRPLVLVYGGALHNDLYPYKSTRQWSYALSVDTAVGGRYVELDLYAPEQVEGNPLYEGEDWYPLVAKTAADRVVLVERAPHSYLMLLPRSK